MMSHELIFVYVAFVILVKLYLFKLVSFFVAFVQYCKDTELCPYNLLMIALFYVYIISTIIIAINCLKKHAMNVCLINLFSSILSFSFPELINLLTEVGDVDAQTNIDTFQYTYDFY